MIKVILALLLILTAQSLTIQVTNIHLNQRNIYVSEQHSLQSSYLTLKDYQMTKQDLDKDKLGFITNWGKLLRVNFNKLLRCYNIEQIETLKHELNYQSIDRGDVFVKIFTENDTALLNEIARLGKSEFQLDL